MGPRARGLPLPLPCTGPSPLRQTLGREDVCTLGRLMEKEEVFLCLVEKEKVREEKDVYTLVEGGEGERERDEFNLGGVRK